MSDDTNPAPLQPSTEEGVVTDAAPETTTSADAAPSDPLDGDPATTDTVEDMKAQLERTLALHQEEIEALQNESLRTRADAENYRKRIEREKAEAVRFANSHILLDMITVLDNFERALSSVEKTEENAALFDGIDLIQKEWIGVLGNNWGVREMISLQQAFDPQLHEAVAIEEDANATQEYVGDEFQKGYWLHSRVLRPAKVKVIKPV